MTTISTIVRTFNTHMGQSIYQNCLVHPSVENNSSFLFLVSLVVLWLWQPSTGPISPTSLPLGWPSMYSTSSLEELTSGTNLWLHRSSLHYWRRTTFGLWGRLECHLTRSQWNGLSLAIWVLTTTSKLTDKPIITQYHALKLARWSKTNWTYTIWSSL